MRLTYPTSLPSVPGNLPPLPLLQDRMTKLEYDMRDLQLKNKVLCVCVCV